MASRDDTDLSVIEQHILLAVIRQQPNAYGVSIADEIAKRTGRLPSTGSVYASLERLTAKGFVQTQTGPSTPERGGRAKVFFLVTTAGRRCLDRTLANLDAMRQAAFKGAPA